jgi:tRNA dimethylallyltransferase
LRELSLKTVVIIAGPTAVGKTAVAIQLAKHFQTEIIAADSRQCFNELDIGVARPSENELKEVTHHFIASHSVQQEVTAITFEQYALKKVRELFKLHDIVIMVGGTGLYIKAFCEGMDIIPAIDPVIREQVIQSYTTNGIGWLKHQLQEKDPEFSQQGEMQNPQRMMRALEVLESTGQSILTFRKGEKVTRDFNIIKIGLELPREELLQHINTRVDKMIEKGLIEEVRQMLPFKNLNALQTVGYKELFDYLDDKISLADAVSQIKMNTRQYAKRQMTWFKKDAAVKWFSPLQVKEMIELVETRHSWK